MLSKTINKFNIRVYGIYINENFEVLLAKEKIQRNLFLKFPGGGLEFGEGIEDCLRREWKEETGLTFEELTHYYTTGFFQQSIFDPKQQVVSVYYIVYSMDSAYENVSSQENHNIELMWKSLDEPLDLTLPIDQHVEKMLINDYEMAYLSNSLTIL